MFDIKFVLLDTSSNLVDEWNRAFFQYNPTRNNFTFLQSKLEDLPRASSDYFLSQAIAPPSDSDAPTKIAQKVLYSKRKGFAPPGTRTLIPLNDTVCFPNQHLCHYIALCLTMRMPERVDWNREIVYNCVWALLCEINAHNANVKELSEDKIRTVVMTGLATGVGNVSAEHCAQQMALAFRDFYDACAT